MRAGWFPGSGDCFIYSSTDFTPITSAAAPTFVSPALEKLKLAGSSCMVASAVITELSANTPSPLNQVARFMVLFLFSI